MVHSDNQTHAAAAAAPRPTIATVAELRASGHAYETVKEEIRRNLLAAMRAGEHRFPGIIGFDYTVIPQLERALLAGHDTMLLGERGQGKTRLIRTLPELLDEWTPAVAGCEINDHPTSRPARGAAGSPRRWATTCRSAGGTATTGTARSSPPRTPASAT